MKAKTTLVVVLLLSTLKSYSQLSDSLLEPLVVKQNTKKSFVHEQKDTILVHDTTKQHSGFGKEKAGAVCVNGLEKLELAYSSNRSFLAINQLHFYAPWLFQGRWFTTALREEPEEHIPNGGGGASISFETSIDLTLEEFPIHGGYTLGLDRFNKEPNTTYSGFTMATYLSDIPIIHEKVHIFRVAFSYLSFSQHLVNHHNEDSIVHLGRKPEAFIFIQPQPYHLTNMFTLSSEGFIRIREGGKSLSEIELVLRHKKFLNDAVGIGAKIEWKDYVFQSVAATIRFNISNPNPKHN